MTFTWHDEIIVYFENNNYLNYKIFEITVISNNKKMRWYLIILPTLMITNESACM